MGIIDRHQAEELAWEGYVGDQTPKEFLSISREQGHVTAKEAVEAYVATLPQIMPDAFDPLDPHLFDGNEQWVVDDLPTLLLGYIERTVAA